MSIDLPEKAFDGPACWLRRAYPRTPGIEKWMDKARREMIRETASAGLLN